MNGFTTIQVLPRNYERVPNGKTFWNNLSKLLITAEIIYEHTQFLFQCLNVLVQHGTAPDYYDERKEANGKLYGCTCPKGDPTTRVKTEPFSNFS